MTRRLNLALAILLLVVGVPAYWLLFDNRPGDTAPKPVSIAQLRQLAAALPGNRPTAVEIETVASRDVPGTLFAAGTGLKQRTIAVAAFRLAVPGGAPVIIDTGLTRQQAQDMGIDTHDGAAQTRVDRAMDGASLVLLTHEHPDHIGGLAARGETPAALLNPAQKATLREMQSEAKVEGATARTALFAAAPGIVVVPAPSHTPGSQIIYVQLADGLEFLFAGDIATLESSWKQTRARSRVVGDYLAPEDRTEVFAWLRTIAALQRSAPRLIVIPGHDAEAFAGLIGNGALRAGFTSPPLRQ